MAAGTLPCETWLPGSKENDERTSSIKSQAALLTAAVVFVGGQALWRSFARPAGEDTLAGQRAAPRDPQRSLPPIADAALRAEVEAATTSTDLEQVLTRHAAQAEIIVPRIEVLAVAEIRRDGPRDRFVIPGLEPDEGPPNSESYRDRRRAI